MNTAGGDKSIAGGQGEGASHAEAPFSFDPSLPLENDHHERFILEVLAGASASKAYSRVYPDASYNSARSAGARLLANVDVKARLEFLQEERRTRLKMTADEVLFGLTMAARFDPADLYKPDGTLIPIHELPPETRLCIERVEFEEITVGEGASKRTIGRTGKVHAMSKKAAYEMLAKHHKLLTDKVELKASFTLEDLLAGGDKEEAPQ